MDCSTLFLVPITKIHYGYILIAALLSGSGLFLDNDAIILGSMLLSPIIKPLLLLFNKLVLKDYQGFVENSSHLFLFGVIAIGIGLIFGKGLERNVMGLSKQTLHKTHTILDRRLKYSSKSDPMTIGLLSLNSIISGVAIALSTYYDKGSFTSIIAGASLSLSILPPLVGGGIALGLQKTTDGYAGLKLSALNLGLVFVSYGVTRTLLVC
jgi:uncharacterized membrane protein